MHELWYVEDVGEPLASRGVDSSLGRKGVGVECFLCDAGACKKFHDDIFIAVLVVCPMLSQLRFGKQESYVYENLEIEMQPWWCRLYLISHHILRAAYHDACILHLLVQFRTKYDRCECLTRVVDGLTSA